MLKISIVVPVYNGEHFIERCIESIEEQSYKNIEVITINDGSKDNSLKMLKNMSKKYGNIKVVTGANGGVSVARNKGIAASTGDFITFIDVDDALKKDAIKNMVESLKNKTDIVIGGLEIRRGDKILSRLVPEDNAWARLKYTSTQFKLYRKSFLEKNDILFEKRFSIGEDMLFFYKAISNTKNVEVCSTTDYLNYKNDESVTANICKRKNMLNMLDTMKYMYDNNLLSSYSKDAIKFLYLKISTLNVLLQINSFKIKELVKLYKENYNWIKEISGESIKTYNQEGETRKINLIVNLFVVFNKIHMLGLLIFLLGLIKINKKV